MYKSRKKIIGVGCVSAVVLVGFGVGAWAIIDASYKNPSGDATQSKYYGATEYLSENNGQLDINTMSVSDWINYNMPKTLVVNENSDGSKVLDFYNTSFSATTTNTLENFINTNKYKNLIAEVKLQSTANSYNYKVYTNPYAEGINPLEIATSDNSISGNNISINNKVSWLNQSAAITLNQTQSSTNQGDSTNSNTTTVTKVYNTSQDYSGHSLQYKDVEVSTKDDSGNITTGTSTRTYSVKSGDNSYEETYTKQLNSNNFTISYKGALDSTLTATYTTTHSSSATKTDDSLSDSNASVQYYYSITYANGSTQVSAISTYQRLWFNNNAWQMSLSKDINLFFFLIKS